MTSAGMAALRIAATLAHALPTLRVRVRHEQRTLLEVANGATGGESVVGACGFRRAVARAHEQTKQGIRLGFIGLPEGAEPVIDIGVRTGDGALPGGIYRVAIGDNIVHGFATTLSPRRCRELLEAIDDDCDLDGNEKWIRLHHDRATEVTLVHTVAPSGAPADVSRLEDMLAALLADEVVQELAATTGF